MKIVLNIFFKIFKAIINKLPIPTNKTSKKNWDWLKLDKDETFTKILAVIFLWGILGIYLILLNYFINNFEILNSVKLSVFNSIEKIAQIKLFYNYLVAFYFFTWLITMIIIIKNHNKKPLIQKVK